MYLGIQEIGESIKKILADLDSSKSIDRKDVNGFVNVIIRDLQMAKEAMGIQIIGAPNDLAVFRIVKLYQSSLITMLDMLYDRAHIDSKASHEFDEEMDKLIITLIEFHNFLRINHAVNFDNDFSAFKFFKVEVFERSKGRFQEVMTKFGVLDIDPKLVDLIVFPIKDFINDLESDISYRRIAFIEKLMDEILYIDFVDPINCKNDFLRICCALNFNSPKTFKYFTDFLIELTRPLEGIFNKIELLDFYTKLISQTNTIANFGYDGKFKSLKHQMLSWIQEETVFLGKKVNYAIRDSTNSVLVGDKFKLNLNLSVSQLAYLIKVLLNVGLLQNKNVSELIRFFSNSAATKKSEQVSFESLRIKFYNVESGTKAQVRDIIKCLFDYIDRDRS